MTIKVLQINKFYYPATGGIETLVRQYSEELSAYDDIEVSVLTCRHKKGSTVTENVNGISVKRMSSVGTYFSCPLSFSFIREFKRKVAEADVIEIHYPFPLADVALLLSGYKGKVILAWHSDIVKQKKFMFFYKPFMKYLLKRADKIIVATEGHVRGSLYLSPYKDKITVIPYGLDILQYDNIRADNYLKQMMTDESKVKILFTGRLVYYKGVDILIEAFARTHGAELFICGEGIMFERLQKLVEELNIQNMVHFQGFLESADLKRAFADTDIFVLPSVKRSEAFGIVQLEAMVYGKPVINTDLPSGVPFVSVGDETGLTCEPSNVEALAASMQKLIDDKDLRIKFGKAARERVEKCFDERLVIQKLHDLIVSIVNDNH